MSRRYRLLVPVTILATAFVFLLSFSLSGCEGKRDVATQPSLTTSTAQIPGLLGKSDPRVQAVINVQNRHGDRLMAIDGVVGTGTGLNSAGQPVIKVFTAKPGVTGVPKNLDGVAVEVEETGAFEAFSSMGRYRPVPIGVSVGNNLECAAGTIGCVVIINGQNHILSNNHVLARENAAQIGEHIVQPGRYDNKPKCANKLSTDKVAELTDFELLKFDGTSNTMDAAVALYTSTTSVSCATRSGFYGSPSSTVARASIGLAIKEVGRTTDLTTGKVTAINVTVNVNYGSSGIALFTGQIMTSKNFSRSGDSGSLVVTNTGNNPVALLFAGTNNGQSVVSPIEPILSRFSATICSTN